MFLTIVTPTVARVPPFSNPIAQKKLKTQRNSGQLPELEQAHNRPV